MPSKKSKKPSLRTRVSRLERGVETKYHNFNHSLAEVTNTGVQTNCFNPIQGDGQSERIGNVAIPTWIEARARIYSGSTSKEGDVRIVLVQRKHNDETANATLLTDYIDAAGTNYAVLGRRNWEYRNDFHVLYDKTFNCVFETETQDRTIRIKAKPKTKTQFDGDTSAVAKGAIFMWLITNKATTFAPEVDVRGRVLFKDS